MGCDQATLHYGHVPPWHRSGTAGPRRSVTPAWREGANNFPGAGGVRGRPRGGAVTRGRPVLVHTTAAYRSRRTYAETTSGRDHAHHRWAACPSVGTGEQTSNGGQDGSGVIPVRTRRRRPITRHSTSALAAVVIQLLRRARVQRHHAGFVELCLQDMQLRRVAVELDLPNL
jgi:hypothetical protein